MRGNGKKRKNTWQIIVEELNTLLITVSDTCGASCGEIYVEFTLRGALLELAFLGKVAAAHFGRQRLPLKCLFGYVLTFGGVFGGHIEIVVGNMERIVINSLYRVIYPVDSQMCCITENFPQIT